MFNQRKITLVPLTPKQVYEDQVRLKKESEKKKESESTKIREAKTKRRVKECEEVLVSDERKERKQKNFYARKSEIKRALFSN